MILRLRIAKGLSRAPLTSTHPRTINTYLRLNHSIPTYMKWKPFITPPKFRKYKLQYIIRACKIANHNISVTCHLINKQQVSLNLATFKMQKINKPGKIAQILSHNIFRLAKLNSNNKSLQRSKITDSTIKLIRRANLQRQIQKPCYIKQILWRDPDQWWISYQVNILRLLLKTSRPT